MMDIISTIKYYLGMDDECQINLLQPSHVFLNIPEFDNKLI